MLFSTLTLLLAVASRALAAPRQVADLQARAAATDKLVFAHFMIGIVSDRTSAADYDDDMKRAKAAGIDAFALNIGVDPYTDQQLGYAFQSAANNGMKAFISFDFNWYSPSQATQVGQKIAQYATSPGQLFIGDAAFASSFSGDGLDVDAVRAAAARDIFFVPNFHVGQGDFSKVDGVFNWLGWPSNGNNKAPTPGANVTVQQGDAAYRGALGSKPYMAPVSPWFFTHYGPEVSYSKNWVFPGDSLWYDRWNEILNLGAQYIEIVTWNDYGESHYVGPLSSKHYDDGGSKWTNDMPHDAWLDMAKPFIAAYKAGSQSVGDFIKSDQIFYWYRPNPSSLNCDSTDTTMQPASNTSGNYFEGKPNGWETLTDNVFVVTLLTSPASLSVWSGSNQKTFDALAGASSFTIPLGVGHQQFLLQRGTQTVLSGTSFKDVRDTCICGLYNFNAYTGSLPEQPSDPMGSDGLNSLTQGLHVSTCSPTPSLPASAPAPPPTAPGKPATSTTATTTTRPSTMTATTTATGNPSTATMTNKPPSTTVRPTTTSGSGTCTTTVTASSQIFPTNCLQPCQVWKGPPGQGTPDKCDGRPPCSC